MIRVFEFAKPGWMKRWVALDDDDQALLYQLTELAQTLGCSFRQLGQHTMQAGPHYSLLNGPHYILPEDAAQFFLELPVYYLNPHAEGKHLEGRHADCPF